MSGRRRIYRVCTRWSGLTTGYREYSRDHVLSAEGRPDIAASSDPAFLGSPDRWNPEQLLVASLSACHKLWFLHLASDAGLIVTHYEDEAEGVLIETDDGGQFESVTLRPRVRIAAGDAELLDALHEAAHARCFIARSVRFDVSVAH